MQSSYVYRGRRPFKGVTDETRSVQISTRVPPRCAPRYRVEPAQSRRGVLRKSKENDDILAQVVTELNFPPSPIQPQAPANTQSTTEAGGAAQETSSSSVRARAGPPASLSLPPGSQLGGGKYTVQEVLGTGSNATTYKATTEQGTEVAIKALTFSSLKDWKQLDLFQREAQTLKALQHPGIPRYLDYFEEDTDNDKAFYIVQEVAGGKSLGDMIREGMRCSDQEAERITRELLLILEYLQSLRPQVIHRDVKPENIVLQGGAWGGRVYLVDFGGVQGISAAADAQGFASTVIGTYGYMAPEQFRGAAQPASDLYALGGTLLFLLSGMPPSSFPQERMRTQWRSPSSGFSAPSPKWASLLDGLLEPVAEDRLTASQALEVLEGRGLVSLRAMQETRGRAGEKDFLNSAPMTPGEARLQQAGRLAITRVLRKPAGSRVILERTTNRLDVTIPPKGMFNSDTVMTGAFAIAWNAFVAFWTFGALAGGGLLFALFSAPFWLAGWQLGKQAVSGALMRERLAIGRSRFRLGQELALLKKDTGEADFQGGGNEKVVEGLTEDLIGARLITTMFVNDVPQTAVEVVEGVRKYRFGEGLAVEEQQWLVSEINNAVEDLKGAPVDSEAFPPAEIPRNFRDDSSGVSRETP